MYGLIIVCAFLTSSSVLSAGKLDKAGRAWLDAHNDAPAMNVDGTWDSDEFGEIHLSQENGSRDVSGIGGGYEIVGVVSGKHLYLLFLTGNTVEYCSVLNAGSGNSMMGTYSNRVSRFGSGLCQKSTRPIFISKK
jgi:hypothetical protein